MSDNQLRVVQAASGLCFGSFLCIHLVNAAAAASSVGMYEGILLFVRNYYQHPYVEPLLIGAALSVHQISSSLLLLRRWRKQASSAGEKPPIWLRLHRWSGYVLSVFVGGHFMATRGVHLLFGYSDADFSLVSHSLRWLPLFFYPYYLVFASGAIVHGIIGSQIAIRRLLGIELIKPGSLLSYSLIAASVAVVSLALFGFGGLVYPVYTTSSRAAELSRMYTQFVPAALLRYFPLPQQ